MVRQSGLRAAIDRKCRECIYDPVGGCGSWRQQVAACSSSGCPLYPVRPVPVGWKRSDVGLA